MLKRKRPSGALLSAPLQARLFHHVEDAAVMREQCFAGARETDAARAAIDECGAGTVFQCRDSLARLRARDAQMFRSFLETQRLAIRTNSSTSAIIMDLAPVALPLLRVVRHILTPRLRRI